MLFLIFFLNEMNMSILY